MAAAFVAASHQYLISDRTPITAPPFTMACWANPTFAGNSGGNQCAFSIGASGTSQANFSLGVDGSPEWWIRRNVTAGSNLQELDVSAGIVANTWQFALARVISATNIWLHIFNAAGTVSSGQMAVSVLPTGINQMTIGSFGDGADLGNDSFDGLIGEAWMANIDVWPGGGAIDDLFVRYLAWNGPWSVPRVAAAIRMYRPMRQTLGTGTDVPQENYSAGTVPPIWTNTNGVTLAPHCPLGPVYPRPSDTRRIADI